MKIRFLFALWMAKLSIVALKITGHNGTEFPGRVALKLCPDFLKLADKPGRIIGITGTNGKTTIANLIIDMFAADGKKVLENNRGSNTVTGIATSFVKASRGNGKCRYENAVLEIDERTSRILFNEVQPDYLLINNLTRDSIMRNGHPEFIARILTEHIPDETKLICNGDDLIASSVAPSNDRVYFGIDRMDGDVNECINLINDMQICPKCHSKLKFEYLRYHHIGKAYCPNCSFRSPECDYRAGNVDLKKMSVDITHDGTTASYRLLNDSVFNIYNVVALVAVMQEIGYKPERISELLEKVEIVSSRYDVKSVGDYRVIRQMSKDRNALGSSRAFDYVSHQKGRKEIILMMNNLSDARTWSENVCWLYDCDFEFLNNDEIVNIICTGPRSKDYKLRLKMAGISDEKISLVDDELTAPHSLRLNEPCDIYILYGTDSVELADKVADEVKTVIEKTEGEAK